MNSRLFTRSPRRRWKAPLRAPRSLVFYPGSSPFDATCKVAVTRRLRRTDLSGRRQMLAPLRAGGSCCFCGRKATPVKIRQLVSLPPARRDTVRLGRQVADRSKKRPRLLPPKHGAIREPRGGERGNPVALSSYAPRGKGRRPHMPRSYFRRHRRQARCASRLRPFLEKFLKCAPGETARHRERAGGGPIDCVRPNPI